MLFGIALWLTGASVLAGQDFISVRAGVLSQTDGCVLVDGRHMEFKSGRLVHLSADQRLATEDGRAELMLGPEAFLRLGYFSEVVMISPDLDAPQVRLSNGSVVIDVNGLIGKAAISVLVADAEVRLLKKGFYRIDLTADDPPKVRVLDGNAAVLAGGKKRILEDNEQIIVGDDLATAAKEQFRRSDDGDFLDQWSDERATAIARVNGKLLRKRFEEERRDSRRRFPNIFGIDRP